MENHVLSGLMGLCVGDAIGVPVEFKSREYLKSRPVLGLSGYGTHNQKLGTWSDDTSLSLCLADSLNHGLDYDDIMNRFSLWLSRGEYTASGEVFDVGISTKKAIKCYQSGGAPLSCGGSNENDNGNGSLMRILPLLFYLQALYGIDFQENDEAFEIIHNVSSLTHAHNRSRIGCGIYLSVAAMLLGNMDLKSAIDLGIYKALDYYGRYKDYKNELKHYSRLSDNSFFSLTESEIKSSGYVVDTLEAAIWCLGNSSTYQECVLKAVNLGNDTDTVAAVAGGFAGLYYGYDCIPKNWIEQIVNLDYVEEIANRLNGTLKQRSIADLHKFVPFFEAAFDKKVCNWLSGGKISDNFYSTSHPVYDSELYDFVRRFERSNLVCFNYVYVIDKYQLDKTELMHDAIEKADLELTLAILTGYIRQERFCDGLWEDAIREGIFLKLIRRLDSLSFKSK